MNDFVGLNGEYDFETEVEVDTRVGKIRARAQTSDSNPSGTFDTVKANTGASIGETFTVSGSGSIAAVLSVEGAWDTSYPGVQNFGLTFNINQPDSVTDAIFYSAGDVIEDTGGVQTFSPEPVFAETINRDFSITKSVLGGEELSLTAFLFVESAENGFSDFSSTASLTLFASPGVVLSASDSLFLSENPIRDISEFNTPMVPVPLTSSWSFLIVSFGILMIPRKKSGLRSSRGKHVFDPCPALPTLM